MIDLCLVYFRSVTLQHLDAAAFSLSWQDLSLVERICVLDNNTEDRVEDIHAVTAVGDGPTISLHVYGADIERLGSSIYRHFDDWPVRRAAQTVH